MAQLRLQHKVTICCRSTCASAGALPLPSHRAYLAAMLPAVSMPEQRRSPLQAHPKHRITAKVRNAIDLMVWHGLKRAAAAQQAKLHDNSLYIALRKPDVKRYYLEQCEVLRLSGRARRIHRLEEIVEQDDNKQAVVNAIRALDQMPDDVTNGNRSGIASSPGFVIVIGATAQTADLRNTPAKPLIEHDARYQADNPQPQRSPTKGVPHVENTDEMPPLHRYSTEEVPGLDDPGG